MTIDVSELRNNLESLRARWLSNDPIQIGDVNLPLRPLVGLSALALALVGINSVLKDDVDLTKPKPVETASIAGPSHPAAMERSPSGFDRLDGYPGDARVPAPWTGEGAVPRPGYSAGYHPAPFSYGAPPGANGYQAGYHYGGEQSFGRASEGNGFGHSGAGPAPAAYQGFRFREEAASRDRVPDYWRDPDGYRFRPLNDQERERMHAAAERSLTPEAGARSLYDELSGSYGGALDRQSAPARPDYSRTW